MISVPNHRQLLSGNNISLVWVLLLVLVACAGPKPAVHHPPDKAPTPPAEEKVKVYDPASGTYILVPRSAVKVDTVKWTEDTQPPLVTDKKVEPDKPKKKDSFQISLLMPFESSTVDTSGFDGKVNRFLQYYGGVQLAMSEVDSMGYRVSLHTYDANGTTAQIQTLLEDPAIKASDVIIGPYDKEEIEAVAAFGMKHETMVVSPWLPAFTIAEENPYFIQATPGLATHAEAISNYIAVHWPGRKVFLVARDKEAEINRIALFRKNDQLHAEDLIIKDDSPDLSKTFLQKLLSDEGTIFILPYYAKADEAFINSFLRKLHAEKETKEVMVFGLPQWLGFSNLNPNYMESMSVHISVSTFINPDHEQYDSFRQKYFNRYHTIPDLQAFLGYDLIKWISDALIKSGKEGMIGTSSTWFSGIASGYDIRPVYKSKPATSLGNEMKTPLYYENTRIRILKYEGQDFHLLE